MMHGQILAWFFRHERQIPGVRMSVGINLCVKINTKVAVVMIYSLLNPS